MPPGLKDARPQPSLKPELSATIKTELYPDFRAVRSGCPAAADRSGYRSGRRPSHSRCALVRFIADPLYRRPL
jgi:hypothetical protein